MTRDYWLFIEEMLSSMRNAREFIEGLTFAGFIQDRKTLSAVARELEVVGEAAKNIPAEVRSRYPQIPWASMAGMRDRLIHGYFGVKHDVVWKTITVEFVALIPLVEKALSECRPQQGDTDKA
jgi:uncharacterized protein with HEPN domain